MDTLTPKQIVQELDRYIIGQNEAKIAVAIALRNRYRRSKLSPEMREEITPKNILMKGPTGVGKTEIARRLAKIVKAPFVKVEATKFTEVGYVGRDVESIIRDLVEVSIRMVKDEKFKEVLPKATEIAERNLVDIILPIRKKAETGEKSDAELKEELLQDIRAGHLDGITIKMEVKATPKPIQLNPNAHGGEIDMGGIIGNIFGGGAQKKVRTLTVKQAMDFMINQESEKMVDQDAIITEALRRAEQDGVVFLDEIDKVAAKSGREQGHDVSREGVQRDILPIVEGCTVQTKHGTIRTDFILFVAAGAFHISKMGDLIPELQGRFPIRVELNNLTEADFVRILKEPDNAVLKQYKALLGVDGVELNFTDEAIEEIAKVAYIENENNENLGARRLHAVMEHLLKEVLYDADDNETKAINVDKDFVDKHIGNALKDTNLRKYIL
ncbi:MAG: ATP-dependent protease ATPase subunit HslU [Clostridia bacterium]|nr:ATP-dependent protease ATPase subunit HslU [Clostridia bacterium]MBO7222421.1 ATP-dependent protease ATPase subunit HslU [Clostridia bacterium]MBO7325964.1 ATP-dependent protease ATPase subunit HslU [Clostridia bacterium]MBR5173965.1 ATP-dependent protease ATPase subunit HslU [Clostridia bacterium]